MSRHSPRTGVRTFSKLTAKDRERIIALRHIDKLPLRAIANRYGVSDSSICRVLEQPEAIAIEMRNRSDNEDSLSYRPKVKSEWPAWARFDVDEKTRGYLRDVVRDPILIAKLTQKLSRFDHANAA